jgi:hypothetical protein
MHTHKHTHSRTFTLIICWCFSVLSLLLSTLMPSHFTLPSCTFLPQISRTSAHWYWYLYIAPFLCILFYSSSYYCCTVHRWKGLLRKYFTVKSMPVVFGASDKYNLIIVHIYLVEWGDRKTPVSAYVKKKQQYLCCNSTFLTPTSEGSGIGKGNAAAVSQNSWF